MPTTNGNSSWEMIQQGVGDVERLICQKEYNASMIKARQTLEFMVRLLTERAGITDVSDLKNQIDELYQNAIISKATFERYHKIRMIGNKAAHEGDANAYDANQSYHMLSQEVYAFSDTRNIQKNTRAAQNTHRNSSGGSGVKSRPVSSSASRSRRRQSIPAPSFTFYDLLKILIPVLCIILLFFVVKLVRPDKDNSASTKEPTATAATMAETETAAETTSAGAETQVYKTTTVLNIRPQPSTDSDRIGQLEAGASVEYIEAYDDTWAKIRYNGQEAYVASQYLATE